MVNLHSGPLRTADVARRSGYSVQQIRNLERAGVLPPATRSPGGHRVYGEVHAHAALAYRGLAAGTGPAEARAILRAVLEGDLAGALSRLDAAHAHLHGERADLDRAVRAASAITAEPIGDVRADDLLTISELAGALGVRASTLRHWDATALVVPDRASDGSRRYTPAQVRDARVVHQLRRAGYGIDQLHPVLADLRAAARTGDLRAALAARAATLTDRSRALLDAAAALHAVIRSG
ncbi:MerR family transcriptional regulator [Nocardia thailandica]|uniref:MerR family transcriptional regulator n=1 Tax=Nocardia thailandica TaxID=257275 RepID=UPI0002E4499C|nr:MerR family transcriptional regulator [Nocardia thailandica]